MNTSTIESEWAIIAGLLPDGWRELARSTGAIERGRNVRDPDTLLRLILLHVAAGLSLRQTSARAAVSGLAFLSDVALMKRLRKAGPWLREIANLMFRQRPGVAGQPSLLERRVLVTDATTVAEPGSTGTDWRIHYSLRLDTLECDQFVITGRREGETFRRLTITPGDVVMADRGYCHRAGIAHVIESGGHPLVRLAHHTVPLTLANGKPFPLLRSVRKLKGNAPREWKVQFGYGGKSYPMRLCAIRKSTTAAEKAKRKMLAKAKHHGHAIKDETLELAEYVMVLTSLPEPEADAGKVLDLYRCRWQIELVFRRIKSLLHAGHVPKHDPASAQAWLHAKLLAALLIERLGIEAKLFSPWGFQLDHHMARDDRSA